MVDSDKLRQALAAYKQYQRPYLNAPNWQDTEQQPLSLNFVAPAQNIIDQSIATSSQFGTTATADVENQAAAARAAQAAASGNKNLREALRLAMFRPDMPGQGNNGSLTGLQDSRKPVNAPVARAFGVNGKPGVAFDTSRGDQIRAIANGVVKDILPNGTIIMRNGQRYQSIYKGLADVNVQVGQKIMKGTVLGTTGQENFKLQTLQKGSPFDPFKAFMHATGPSDNWRHNVVQFAKQQIGDPYVLGAEGPGQFDCSGLVQYVFGHFGFALPRTAGEQDLIGHHVPLDRLRPGDLVTWEYGDGDDADHVAIFAGYHKGQPWIIEAPRPGEFVRRVPLEWNLAQATGIRVNLGKAHRRSEGP